MGITMNSKWIRILSATFLLSGIASAKEGGKVNH